MRIDNYDWLRDRKDPRVVAYLDAENAYADARLGPIKPLVNELAAELKARTAQEEASVPATHNGYVYERRFTQGAQYPLIVRRKDAPWSFERGGRARCRRARCRASAANISLVHGPSARTTSASPSRSISPVTVNFASLCARSRPARWSMKALTMQPPDLVFAADSETLILCPQRTDNRALLSGLAASHRTATRKATCLSMRRRSDVQRFDRSLEVAEVHAAQYRRGAHQRVALSGRRSAHRRIQDN